MTGIYNLLPQSQIPTDIGATAAASSSSAQLRAIRILPPVADPNAETPVIGEPPSIGFNSAIGTYDFNPNDGISAGALDFDAVATHEIGHALGFLSWNGINEIAPTAPIAPTVWDFFRLAQGSDLRDLPAAARIQRSAVEADFVSILGGLPLSTGGILGDRGDGFQSSHWKQGILFKKFNGVMDPALPPGFRYSITINDITALDTFGYAINPAALRKLPAVAFLKARVDASDVLRVNGVAIDGNKDLQSGFLKLYNAAGQILAISGVNVTYRSGVVSTFEFQISNFSRFNGATQISFQSVDADANYSPSIVATIARNNNN